MTPPITPPPIKPPPTRPAPIAVAPTTQQPASTHASTHAPDIMLDLETMGKVPGSAIVAIGAVKFGEGRVLDQFYARVDLQSCVNAGLTIDADTVLWWMRQSDAARAEITGGKCLPVDEALAQFARWMGPIGAIWGNGADFDNTILTAAYAATRLQPWQLQPWQYWQNRCYRTMRAIFRDVPMYDDEKPKTAHHALEDAAAQAKHLMRILAHAKTAPNRYPEAPTPAATIRYEGGEE